MKAIQKYGSSRAGTQGGGPEKPLDKKFPDSKKKPEFQIDLLGSCSLDAIYTLENAQQHFHNCFVHPVINEKKKRHTFDSER